MIKQLTFTIVALLALTAPAGAQFALDWRTLPRKSLTMNSREN
jgi:hypothetical protein